MFRIRRIFDDSLRVDRRAIDSVAQILREQFPGAPAKDADELAERLKNPVKYRFRSMLFIADGNGGVKGFALVFHDRTSNFLYLDYVATAAARMGSGVGGALYQRVREEGEALGVVGVFLECLPDDRDQCESVAQHRGNVARLRFYERFGAFPLANNTYDAPVKPGDTGMPYLVFDGLGARKMPARDAVRKVVRAILEGKYAHLCPPAYISKVVSSFKDDPVQVRAARYIKKPDYPGADQAGDPPLTLVCNTGHDIHHVRERGYVESPVRISAILREIEPTGLFRTVEAREFPDRHILAVHGTEFVRYLKTVCASIPEGKSVYPYVFPIRNQARPPKELAVRAGYYCIDTFTPLNANAYLAARGAVDCALTATDAVLKGTRLAYALVRPPGHHAERDAFGGFCYFNNAAIAAQYLSAHGKVAILDVDYHHGNGQQVIFYDRADVFTVSIHGHPSFAYPYFSGFAEEEGEGEGLGTNLNIPLPEIIDMKRYINALDRALARIAAFQPTFLVVALGLDTATGDPTGTWPLSSDDLRACARRIGGLSLPTTVIQEGGYRTRTLGRNARAWFEGLVSGATGRVFGGTS